MDLMVDIIIPTYKKRVYVERMLTEIKATRTTAGKLIATCNNTSAARNRNIGIDAATAKLIIMLDDDITGFFKGWDTLLIEALQLTNGGLVSARLMKDAKTAGPSCSNNYDIITPIIEVPGTPSACIALYKTDLRFDEHYKGSGFEDTDYCKELRHRNPKVKFIITNAVKLIHLNEMKNQSAYHRENYDYFLKKWGVPNIGERP